MFFMPSKRCSTPEYSRKYWRFKRHISYYLNEALSFDNQTVNPVYSEEQIIEMLEEKSGFRIQPRTLRNEMKKIEKRFGESPLEPVYEVNRIFFEKYPPKQPKRYKRKH